MSLSLPMRIFSLWDMFVELKPERICEKWEEIGTAVQ